MPEADVQPHTVTIERVLPSPPTRIFRAFADSRQRRIWDVPEDGWIVTDHHQDFRVGGTEQRRFGPPDAATFHTFGHYLHIEVDRLIISSGVMHHNDVPITASLCTIDITAHPTGTRLKLIDQSLYLGTETPNQRRGGWTQALDRLAIYLTPPTRPHAGPALPFSINGVSSGS